MRITGGKSRGIQLRSLAGRKTRPASDAIREAVFSSLGSRVEGCCFADLYAGTGSYGLEAWSRGAEQGILVDSQQGCVSCIRENIRRVAKSASMDARALKVHRGEVFQWRGFVGHSFDIVFADPPYSCIPEVEIRLFELVDQLLKKKGLLILEKPAELKLTPVNWKMIKQLGKKKGRGPSVALWMRKQL